MLLHSVQCSQQKNNFPFRFLIEFYLLKEASDYHQKENTINYNLNQSRKIKTYPLILICSLSLFFRGSSNNTNQTSFSSLGSPCNSEVDLFNGPIWIKVQGKMQIPPQHFHCGSQISACQVFSNKSLILHNITFTIQLNVFHNSPTVFPQSKNQEIFDQIDFEIRTKGKKQSILFLQIIAQHYAHYQHNQLGKIQFLKFTFSNWKWIILKISKWYLLLLFGMGRFRAKNKSSLFHFTHKLTISNKGNK